MTEPNLTAQNLPLLTDLTDLPPYVVNGAGDYGAIERNAINRVDELATSAFKRLGSPQTAPDDIASLRQSVNELADALMLVSGILGQIRVGIATGKIVAVEGD